MVVCVNFILVIWSYRVKYWNSIISCFTFIVTIVKFVDTILSAPIKDTMVVYTDSSGEKNVGLTDTNGHIIIKVSGVYLQTTCVRQNLTALPFLETFTK